MLMFSGRCKKHERFRKRQRRKESQCASNFVMVCGSMQWGLTIGKTGKSPNGNLLARCVGNWGTKERKRK